MKKYCFYLGIYCGLFIFSCCGSEYSFDEFCADQVFTESRTIPIDFTYKVDRTSKFLEAHKLTADDIKRNLKAEGSNFKVKSLELTSAYISYLREADNSSPALFATIAIADNTLQLVPLLQKDQLLPLIDVPATLFTPEINISKQLNSKGVSELKKILHQQFDLINNDGVSFLLLAEPSPKGTRAHFQLNFKMYVAITYEICRYVPLGQGERICE
ncbi:MAG: hypothetical protein IT267_00370 [Saprospiraceae bacterium]|nr:hypothetical protein [Saprospiraceae bacterium]